MKTTTFMGIKAKTAPPTKKHKIALWENMLGTIWARNSEGVNRYCDYDYNQAILWAGLKKNRDIRVSRIKREQIFQSTHNPSVGQRVLWIK